MSLAGLMLIFRDGGLGDNDFSLCAFLVLFGVLECTPTVESTDAEVTVLSSANAAASPPPSTIFQSYH